VNTKNFGRGLVAIRAFQNTLMKRFSNRRLLLQTESALHHLIDKPFQLSLHGTLRSTTYGVEARLLVQFAPGQDAIGFPVLGASASTTSEEVRAGGFRHASLEIVANKLLSNDD